MTIDKLYILFLAQGQKISTDSRTVGKGDMFFALKGNHFDGNKYVQNSLEKGARYAVTDDEQLKEIQGVIYVDNAQKALQDLALFHRRRLNIPILAITGSNGKTTTKELIKEVLSKRFKVAYTKGNFNNHIGIPLTLLDIKAYDDISIVEMGANHQGEIASYCEYVEPNFGLITNIGIAHLEGFGGKEGVVKGKTELYNYIRETKGKIFLNMDEETLVLHSKNIASIPYTADKKFDFYGRIDEESDSGYLSVIVKDNDSLRIQTQLTGDYNLYNVLAAYTIGRYFEIDKTKVIQAIENYNPSNSRSQIIKRNNYTIIQDAYNANPSSMNEALKNLSKFNTVTIAMLGGMKELGRHSEEEHLKIVDQCIELNIDKIILIGPEYQIAAKKYKQIEYCNNLAQAKDWFKNQNFRNETILLKGSRASQLEKIID